MLKKGMMIAGKYMIKERLGQGGSSRVYLASDGDGMLYTLKAGTDKVLLRREAYLAGEIHSKYFPAFVDYEEQESSAYLVLEYIEGISLQTLLDGGRSFSEKEVFLLMEHVTAALTVLHLHRTPLVHLDIKPANIIITPRGEVRIIDMGAGRMAGERIRKRGGTRGYAAPEQLTEGAVTGTAADVYACGKLLVYLLTGKNPAHPPYEVERRLLHGKGIREKWRSLIEKCLEAEPEKRYPDANILYKELRRLSEKRTGRRVRRKVSPSEVVYVKCIWKSDYERV